MKILVYLIIIFLAPTLILLNFRLLVFNNRFYQKEFSKLGVYQTFKSKEIVNYQSGKLIEFLCCQGEVDKNFYTEREKLHLLDVKKLINLVQAQFLIFLTALITTSLILYVKKQSVNLLNGLRIGAAVTIISILFLWLTSFTNFDFVFLQFHYLSFDNNLWILPQNSNLIKMFPQQFFADFANKVATQTITMSLVILLIGVFLKKKIS